MPAGTAAAVDVHAARASPVGQRDCIVPLGGGMYLKLNLKPGECRRLPTYLSEVAVLPSSAMATEAFIPATFWNHLHLHLNRLARRPCRRRHRRREASNRSTTMYCQTTTVGDDGDDSESPPGQERNKQK